MGAIVLKGCCYSDLFLNAKSCLVQSDICIFWISFDSAMLICLANLLQRHRFWKGSTLRLFCISTVDDDSIQLKKRVEGLLKTLRINALVRILEFYDDHNPYNYDKTLTMRQRRELCTKLGLTNQSCLALDSLTMEKQALKKELKSEVFTASAATKLNEMIQKYSRNDDLVLLNLPPLPKDPIGCGYSDFVYNLTQNIENAVLIKGSGSEFISENTSF
ncbi:hypothetical protein GEMRC1_004416 [Eukaryota sp. GEM-RC1]